MLLETLSARVDQHAARAAETLGAKLSCHRGCTGCCQREVTVFPVEAERLRRHVAEHGAPGAAAGVGCPMLGADGGCRVYEVRPMICRSHGLPIRFASTGAPEDPARRTPGTTSPATEARDVCPLNADAGLDVWAVDAGALLNIDVLNAQLFAINRLFGRGDERVPVGRLLPPAAEAPR